MKSVYPMEQLTSQRFPPMSSIYIPGYHSSRREGMAPEFVKNILPPPLFLYIKILISKVLVSHFFFLSLNIHFLPYIHCWYMFVLVGLTSQILNGCWMCYIVLGRILVGGGGNTNWIGNT